MDELQAMAQMLEHLADQCHGNDRPDCPIIADLAEQTAATATDEDGLNDFASIIVRRNVGSALSRPPPRPCPIVMRQIVMGERGVSVPTERADNSYVSRLGEISALSHSQF